MATKKQTAPVLTKTGECLFREEDGSLWVAESYEDENGNVTTQQMQLQESEE